MKRKINKNFFVFNPKSYLYGERLLEYALVADKVASDYPEVTVFITAPYADLYRLSEETKNIIVTAQHLDGIELGRGMGAVLPESLVAAGAQATFLNHAEKPLTLAEIIEAIKKANELDILTIVCANSVEEARLLASLDIDIILCEPTELIGTGDTSDETYVEETIAGIREVNSNVLIMQAAGISTPEDVRLMISYGADGTGCTSGITEAETPKKMLAEMIKAVHEGKVDN